MVLLLQFIDTILIKFINEVERVSTCEKQNEICRTDAHSGDHYRHSIWYLCSGPRSQ